MEDFRLPIERKRDERVVRSRLRVTRVVPLDAFRQQTFAAALATTRERGASAFRLHARAESVLAFARALAWLIRAFHRPPNDAGAI